MRSGKKLLLLLWAAFFPAAAAVPAGAAGSSAAQFLSLGFGARALGMGETFVAVADDVSSVYYNPAGLAGRPAPGGRGAELLVSHSWHIQSMGLTQFAYARNPFGFSLTYFSAGTMEGRDDEGNPASDFTAEDFAVSGGYAVRRGRFSAGAALKGLRQRIKSSAASAVCADAGLLYDLPSAPVTFGVSAANIGTQVKFKEKS
ncbi:MAG TPA: PorV/PorQ family protein, partial [Elusimicrobiales bacterium]|nr:PorV/PorQ family protein [Elusimicrobiales bacterium]